MKRLLALFCIFSSIIFSSTTKVKASHTVGADLTYTYVGPNVIHLKLRFYRECSGIPAPLSGNISISSASCGQQAFALSMPLVSAGEIITSVCVDTSALTTCHPGGTRYGVEEYVYEQDITLPMICNDWLFEFEECCRNPNQTIIGSPSLYINTTYNNLNAPTNGSPQFLTYPVASFCVGNLITYFQNASDPDGDSLVYKLVNALGAGGASAAYVNPYSGIYPLSSATPIVINSLGQISLTPNMLQTAAVSVRVEEYRNGIQIGSVTRDLEVRVEATCSPNVIPQYNQQAMLSGIDVPCGNLEFDIPFNLELQCNSIVNDDFRAINSLGFPIPIVSVTPLNCNGGLTDSVHVVMSEPFTSGSNFVYTKTGSDGNTILGQCGFSIPIFDSVKFTVNDPAPWIVTSDSLGCVQNKIIVELSDDVYCYTVDQDASSLTLVDAGNGNAVIPVTGTYTYCGPSGDSLSDRILINFPALQALSGPLYLIVNTGTDNNTIANGCGRFFNDGDTMAIYQIRNVIPVSLGSDIDACTNNNEVPVNLNSGYPGGGVLNFQWFFNGSAINGATGSTFAASATGQYGVLTYASALCQGSDTVKVKVMDVSPVDLGGDQKICFGDTAKLDLGTEGMIFQWYINGIAYDQDTFPVYNASANGQYVGASIIYSLNGHFCFSVDTVNITTWPYPTPSLSNQTVCANSLPYVIDAGNAGASYVWLAELPDTLQTYSASGDGTYIVTITNFPGCSVQDSMTLTVENQLEAPILDCSAVSGGGFSTVFSWSDIAGNAGYEVSFDSINWGMANTPVSTTSHGTNSSSTSIYVRAIMTGLCDYGKTSSLFDCHVIVPNIITPNGDGQNDAFLIDNINRYPNNTFKIMNRWGKEVYTAKGYNNTTKVFKGDELSEGRYFYTLDFGDGASGKSGYFIISK